MLTKVGACFCFFIVVSKVAMAKNKQRTDIGAAGHDKPSLDCLWSPQRDWTVLIRTCFTSNIGPV